MTVQSSFLIRCTLHSDGANASGKLFQAQHIQTGAEFRSSTLSEITEWVATQNSQYLATMMESNVDLAEDVQ